MNSIESFINTDCVDYTQIVIIQELAKEDLRKYINSYKEELVPEDRIIRIFTQVLLCL